MKSQESTSSTKDSDQGLLTELQLIQVRDYIFGTLIRRSIVKGRYAGGQDVIECE